MSEKLADIYNELIEYFKESGNKDIESIADYLEKKYSNGQYFTQLGNECLLFMNPATPKEDHAFCKEKLDVYLDLDRALPPHFFHKAVSLYSNMMLCGQDQSVLFMGESGSGKTESAKHILSQLIHIHQKLSQNEKRDLKLKNRILAAQHVLQLFGHCKTISGPNSSRHTVLTEVHYDELGLMHGVQFSSYAFERARVTNVRPHERNFHVLYALISGATAQEKVEWKLHDPTRFSYLSKGSQRSDFDNSRLFKDLRSSLAILGLTPKHQGKLFQVLAGILHLGNIEFFDAQPKGKAQDSAQIRNVDTLELVSTLLGLDAAGLMNALTYQTKVMHGEMCTVFLDASKAAERRDRFAQSLYYLLFSWLLKSMNSKLMMNREKEDLAGQNGGFSAEEKACAKSYALINILDLAGYEVLPKNGFEQFLVNYMNEKAHGLQLKHLVQTATSYGKESIPVALTVETKSTKQCLGFFEDPINGAFQVMEEYGRMDTLLSDEKDAYFIEDLRRANAGNESFLGDWGPNGSPLGFSVKHYFGVTQYHGERFISANLQELGPDFVALVFGGYGCSPCTNPFMVKLFSMKDVVSRVKPGGSYDQISEVYIAENCRPPSRIIPSPGAVHHRTNTLLSRRSAFQPSQTLRREGSVLKNAKKRGTHANEADSSTNCTATELLCEVEELFKALLDATSVSTILCLRVLRSNSGRKGDTVSQETIKRNDTIRTRMGTFRGAHGVLFDKTRLIIQLRAHGVYEWLQMFSSTLFPVKVSYLSLIKATHTHRQLLADVLEEEQRRPLQSINDTHEARESMRDYLWITSSLANKISTGEFYFGTQYIFMTCHAWQVIEKLLAKGSLVKRPSTFRQGALIRVDYSPPLPADLEPPSPIISIPREHERGTERERVIQDHQSYAQRQSASEQRIFEIEPTSRLDNGFESQYSMNASLAGTKPEVPDHYSACTDFTFQSIDVKSVPVKPPIDVEPEELTMQRRVWLGLTLFCTWWIPARLLIITGMKSKEMQIAWREKFTLCFMIFLLSAFLIFYIMGLSYILCPPQKILNRGDLARKPSEQPNVIIRGMVYDMTQFLPSHVVGFASPESIINLRGKDVTSLFPVARQCVLNILQEDDEENEEESMGKMMAKLKKKKPEDKSKAITNENEDEQAKKVNEESTGKPKADDKASGNDSDKTGNKNGWSNEKKRTKSYRDPQCVVGDFSYCHTEAYMFSTLEQYKVASFGMTREEVALSNNDKNAVIVINSRIYNITELLRYNGTLTRDGNEVLLSPPWGIDKTALYSKKFEDDLECLEDYFIGVVDMRHSVRCIIADFILIGSTALVVAVMAFKFLAALQLGAPRDPENLDKFVILQVPCYTEGEESLRKTIESLAQLKYQDERKLLFITADGMIVGSGNDRSTPRIVLDILGVDPEDTPDPAPLSFLSVGKGSRQNNRGKVYAGFFETAGRRVPYIVVIKVGVEGERTRPGNRGKRDSQMVLLRFLSKVHGDLPMNPLELALYHAIRGILAVDPAVYEYILMVDADTQVFPDALNRMISCMLHDAKVMGICGETQIANETESWITMIQVYEYYISHHLAKAFESLFGSVTCLPGCFCMYRIKTAGSKAASLLIDARVLADYAERNVDTLHQKNLLSLGEDRYLTTLMLKYFPTYKIAFTPDAICRTTVPDRWSILLSQRRRWINSTIHNLWELLLLPQLCGCACFSMRFVVVLDLFATLVMPATIAYLFYLIYQALYFKMIPVISLCMLGAVYGMQIVIFLLKRQWQYIGWMVIYIMALPLYGLFIPLYSFWHFDDFSWGNTRRVTGDRKGHPIETEDESFDPSTVPLIKWSEYLALSATARLQPETSNLPVATSIHPPAQPLASHHAVDIDPVAMNQRNQMNPSRPQFYPSQTQAYPSQNQAYQPQTQMDLVPLSLASTLMRPEPQQSLTSSHQLVHSSSSPELSPSLYPAITQNRLGGSPRVLGDPSNTRTLVAVSCHPRKPSLTPTSPIYFPSDDELIAAIKGILNDADLSKITKKSIRDRLAAHFGQNINLVPKRDFINNIIDLILANHL